MRRKKAIALTTAALVLLATAKSEGATRDSKRRRGRTRNRRFRNRPRRSPHESNMTWPCL
jgi:hypothetical protein